MSVHEIVPALGLLDFSLVMLCSIPVHLLFEMFVIEFLVLHVCACAHVLCICKFIRLWLHSFLLFHLQSVVEFSVQSCRYVLCVCVPSQA
jgi:hypothetical protein